MNNRDFGNRNILLAILVVVTMQTIAMIYFEAVSFSRMENITRIMTENSFFEYEDEISTNNLIYNIIDDTSNIQDSVKKLNSKNRDITKA